MPARSRRTVPDDPDELAPGEPVVTACRTSPGRIVFIETDNCDGWIATDTAVECRR